MTQTLPVMTSLQMGASYTEVMPEKMKLGLAVRQPEPGRSSVAQLRSPGRDGYRTGPAEIARGEPAARVIQLGIESNHP